MPIRVLGIGEGALAVLEKGKPLKTHFATAVTLVVCGVFATACNSKIKECNQVTEIVNGNVDALQQIGREMRSTSDSSEEGKHARAMVETVEKAITSLAKLDLRTEGLKPLVAAYVDMLKKIQEGGSEIVTHIDAAGDLSEKKVDESIEALTKAQDGIVKACENPNGDCMKVAAILEKFADDPRADQLVVVFTTLGTELEKLELADDSPLKGATTEFVRVVKEKTALLEKANKVQQGIEAGEKKIDEAVAAEDKLVDDLNNFCGGS